MTAITPELLAELRANADSFDPKHFAYHTASIGVPPATVLALLDRLAELNELGRETRELFGNGLDCEHCGDIAVVSAQNIYWDGDFARCLGCGHPGQIHADGENARFAIAEEETDWCDQKDCAECTERKSR